MYKTGFNQNIECPQQVQHEAVGDTMETYTDTTKMPKGVGLDVHSQRDITNCERPNVSFLALPNNGDITQKNHSWLNSGNKWNETWKSLVIVLGSLVSLCLAGWLTTVVYVRNVHGEKWNSTDVFDLNKKREWYNVKNLHATNRQWKDYNKDYELSQMEDEPKKN